MPRKKTQPTVRSQANGSVSPNATPGNKPGPKINIQGRVNPAQHVNVPTPQNKPQEPEQPVKRGRGRPRKNPKPMEPEPTVYWLPGEPEEEIPVQADDLPDDEDELMALLESSLEDELLAIGDDEDYERQEDLTYGDEEIEDEIISSSPSVEGTIDRINMLNANIIEGIQKIREYALASKGIVDQWGPEWRELSNEFERMANAFQSVP